MIICILLFRQRSYWNDMNKYKQEALERKRNKEEDCIDYE